MAQEQEYQIYCGCVSSYENSKPIYTDTPNAIGKPSTNKAELEAEAKRLHAEPGNPIDYWVDKAPVFDSSAEVSNQERVGNIFPTHHYGFDCYDGGVD